MGIGVTFATWQATLVKQDELHQLKIEEQSWRGSTQASMNAQMGSLQSQVHDLRERQAGIEADVHDLTRLTERLLDQTLEIAKATGAKQVPP